VAGVFEDVPYNSHLRFRVLLSYASMDPSRNTDWNWSEDHTYAMLKAGVEPRVVERKMDALVRMHHSEGSQDQYCLQPLQRIHLHQEAPYGNAVKGDSQMVTFLALAAGLILFIALVNFTNIAIAQTWQRSREIGVRKVMGARQEQVSVQLVSETLVLHTGVFLLSAVLSLAGFPLFHSLTGIPLSYLQVHIGAGLFLVLGFTLLILTASFLPVWFISSCRNWELLKGPFARPRQGIRLRKGLIVLQYAITLVLGAGTWIVYRQIQFLRQQDLGIRIDQVLIVRDPLLTDSLTEGKYEPLKNRLLSHPAIEQVSFSSSIPGKNIDWHRSDIRLDRLDGDQTFSIRIAGVGHDYFQLFELALLAGRCFAPDFGTDQTAMVISAKAAGLLGFAEPEMALEHTVFIGRRQFRVIGVVSDYHHLSFHHPVEPQLYILGSARRPNLSIRLSARQLSETMAFIRQQWQETYPDNVYNAFFLNEFFDRQYQRYQQFGRVMNLFGGISLALSVLGLWSFAFFNNQQRSREMAIRRVLGGSVRQLLGLLMTEYLQLLLMGYLLALPVLWLGIQTWLSHYTHRIPLQGWMVAVPAGIILVLTVLAIVRNTYRVSHVRPVQFLRHD
jgi:putative ABC transport system permease protein